VQAFGFFGVAGEISHYRFTHPTAPPMVVNTPSKGLTHDAVTSCRLFFFGRLIVVYAGGLACGVLGASVVTLADATYAPLAILCGGSPCWFCDMPEYAPFLRRLPLSRGDPHPQYPAPNRFPIPKDLYQKVPPVLVYHVSPLTRPHSPLARTPPRRHRFPFFTVLIPRDPLKPPLNPVWTSSVLSTPKQA